MKRLLFPLLLIAVLLQAKLAAQPPYVRNILDTNLVTLGAGLSLSAGNVLSSSGGAPGGATTMLEMNLAGVFVGATNLIYDVNNAVLSLGSPSGVPQGLFLLQNSGEMRSSSSLDGSTNFFGAEGIGTRTATPLYVKPGGVLKWQFDPNGYFLGPSASPIPLNIGTNGRAISTVTATNVVTQTISLNGSSAGTASFYDAAGTEYSQFLAPPNIQSNNVSVLWSNATAGVVVAQPAGVGTNQLQNVALTAGQYVTYNGSAYVASNLPASTSVLLPHVGGSGWMQVMNEEFLHGALSSSQLQNQQVGNEVWARSYAAGGAVHVAQTYGGVFGSVNAVVTNTGDRATIYTGDGVGGASGMFATNMEIYFMCRTKFSMINDGTDKSVLKLGFLNDIASEPTGGIYFRMTNNFWEGVTANTTRTVTTSSSNVLAETWYVVAGYLDATAANVYFYVGPNETTLTAVATNTATIPNNVLSEPTINWQKHSGTTTRMTNNVDYFKVWVRR